MTKDPKTGRILSGTIQGRRNCAGCGAWRHLHDFTPRNWNDDGTVKYVQSKCRVCNRVDAKRYHASLRPAQRRRRARSSRAWHRRDRRQRGAAEHGARVVANPKPGSVRREPFAAWLREKIEQTSVRYVADRIDLPERRIFALLNGYDTTGRNLRSTTGGRKLTKVRQVDFVQYDTVDRCLMNWGEPPATLYAMYPLDESSPSLAATG